MPPRAIAPPGGQPLADPGAVDAWRLIVLRLHGGGGAGFVSSSSAPGHWGRVAGWLAAICGAQMASREHDDGASWEDAFAAARRTAGERLAAAVEAPDLRALADLAGPSGRQRPARPAAGKTARPRRRR
jgi:hypothetical protein